MLILECYDASQKIGDFATPRLILSLLPSFIVCNLVNKQSYAATKYFVICPAIYRHQPACLTIKPLFLGTQIALLHIHTM